MKKENKLHIFALCLLFLSLVNPVFSDPLSALIQRVEAFAKNPSLRQVNYTSPKYKRSKKKERIHLTYQGKPLSPRYTLLKYLELSSQDLILKKLPPMKTFKNITPETLLPHLYKMKEKGDTFKTGDVVFNSPTIPFSIFVNQYSPLKHSHAGMVWVKNGRPYIVQMHPFADFLILPMEDYLFPEYPDNLSMAIYRYTGKENIEFEMDYILKNLEKNAKKLFYDNMAIVNPPIREPETFLKYNKFICCTELPFLAYQYILGRDTFITNHELDFKEAFRFLHQGNPWFMLAFDIALSFDKGRPIMTSKNFSESKEFRPLFALTIERQEVQPEKPTEEK